MKHLYTRSYRVPRLKCKSQSNITALVLRYEPKKKKPLPSLFSFTVREIYQLIFNDRLLMFNEHVSSALCQFHSLFYYWNVSHIEIGREPGSHCVEY